jgi:hypothetical protein
MASNQDLFKKFKVKTSARKGVPKGTPKGGRKRRYVLAQIDKATAAKSVRQSIGGSPKWFKAPSAVADMFIGTLYEDMSDELQSFKEYLLNLKVGADRKKVAPLVQRQVKARQAELSTLNALASSIPFTMIKPFFKYMKDQGYSLVSEAYSKFIKEPQVKQYIDQMRTFLKSRQAVPSGAKSQREPASSAQRYYPQSSALARCMNSYLYTPWVKGSQHSYKGIAINILKPSNSDPKFRGQYLTSNKGEWYEASYNWYQHVCAYGRSFEKNSVAYLVDDGMAQAGQRRLELEDEDMFHETNEVYLQFKKYTLDKRIRNLECDSQKYKTAPWMPELNVQELVVNTKVLRTLPDREQGFLTRSISEPFSDQWLRLKDGYYKRICSDGRPYISGLIGYLNRTGARLEVIIETENMYRRSLQLPKQSTPQDVKKLLECNISQYRKAPWIPNLVVEDILISLQRLNALPNSPEKSFLVGSVESYYDVNWGILSDAFFEEVCQQGRQFVEGLIGYLTYQEQVEILPETQDLLKMANKMQATLNCQPDLYKKAPWKPLLRIEDMVINVITLESVPDPLKTRLQGYVKGQIPNSPWAKLSSSFFKRACRRPRDFYPNLIGYLRKNVFRKVTPETRQLFNLIDLQRTRTQDYNRRVSYGSEFKSACEQRLSDWLRSRKALSFVARKTPDSEPWLGPQVNGTDWYALTGAWHKQVCLQRRTFIPGLLGLRLSSGEIIPETREMFRELTQALKSQDELTEISPKVIGMAVRLLGSFMNIKIAQDLAQKLVQQVQVEATLDASEDTYSRYLDRVAALVTYASNLINIPQVHVQRLLNNQYTADTLLTLSDEDMLPEIFLDPARDASSKVASGTINWDSFRELIGQRINFFRNQLQRSIRADMFKPYKAPPIIKVNPLPCPVIFDDRVYYLEGGNLQCFDRGTILQAIIKAEARGDLALNPSTGKELSSSFIEKTRSILGPGQALEVSSVSPPRSRSSSRSSLDGSLGGSSSEQPLDLFNATLMYLHNFDASMNLDEGYQFCSQCKGNDEPILKSVKKGKEVSFCSYDCFSKFRF